MSRLRFVHAADLHLDTPFEGLASLVPLVADELRDASLQAWDNLVQLTLTERADALLLAGDIYDGARRGVRAQLRVVRGLEALSAAGIRTFIVHGNHDPLDGWSAIRAWPSGVHVFGSTEVQCLPLTDDGAAVHVHGISYGRRDVRENLAARFDRGGLPGVHLGLLHASVGGSREHDAYAPCVLTDLQASGMDYWALGHIHRRTIVQEGSPWVVYPGNLQGRSPKPSEGGEKGAYVVTIDADRREISPPLFRPLDVVRFVARRVDVGPCADLGALQAALADVLAAARDEHRGRGLIVRIVLEGRGEVVRDLRRDGVLDELQRDLREQHAETRPLLWVEALVDQTAPVLALDAIRARGELSAELLALGERLAASPEELAAFVAGRDAPLLTGQTRRILSGLLDDPDEEILSQALSLALDRLEAGEGE